MVLGALQDKESQLCQIGVTQHIIVCNCHDQYDLDAATHLMPASGQSPGLLQHARDACLSSVPGVRCPARHGCSEIHLFP
jgi:hypothetical protein